MVSLNSLSLTDFSSIPPDNKIPFLDRTICTHQLTHDQQTWRDQGLLILDKFIPCNLIDSYKDCWLRNNREDQSLWSWNDCTPYLRHSEIKDLGLYPPLMSKMKELIGDDMGMHLNLTGWVSTQRNWHQDTILNPPEVNDWYIAVWIALDDIHPDSGPFQFVRGSHKWPQMQRDLLFKYIPTEWHSDPRWPSLTQDAVSKAMMDEIKKRGATIESFVPKKGSVLLWHSRLAHRGSEPKNPQLLRKSFISHYSALSHRPDMPLRKEHTPGCWYFDFPSDTNGTIK